MTDQTAPRFTGPVRVRVEAATQAEKAAALELIEAAFASIGCYLDPTVKPRRHLHAVPDQPPTAGDYATADTPLLEGGSP